MDIKSVSALSDRLAARKPETALARALSLRDSQPWRAFKLLSVAAEAGITAAEREVGICYMAGQGVMANGAEAARWLTRAAEKGDNEARRRLACLYMFGAIAAPPGAAGDLLFGEAASPQADFPAALRYALPAAEDGDVDAMSLAGFIYLTGPAEVRDAEAAERWFAKAAAADSPQGHLGLGLAKMPKALTGEATVEAVEHIAKAAEADLATGHFHLAVVYDYAIGVLRDPEKATKHYGLAAKGGIRSAQAKYGAALLQGKGTKINRLEAETWLRRAGLAGDAEAAYLVGSLYAVGGGALPPSYAEAALWFRRAAEAGHQSGARCLGMLYMLGTGVPRDADEAAVWLRRAAEAGDHRAQSDLASLLIDNRINPKLTETPPVHEWFAAAAESGDLIAAFNYAVCLAEGIGVEKDEAKAALWLRRAAETVLNAQYWYGRILVEGRGVPANPEEARFWLKIAADLELPEALALLGDLHLRGDGGPRDHVAALGLYERAAKRGHAGAMFSLGAMHGGGHDIPTDRAMALRWFRASAEAGHPVAALMLGKYLRLGIATAPAPAEARRWLEKALAAGLAEAQAELDSLTPPDATAAA